MRVQVVHDDTYHRDLGVGLVHQPSHLFSEVLSRPSLGDGYMPPAPQGLTGQKQVAGALPSVLVILAAYSSRLHWQSRSRLGQQLGRSLVKADHRSLWVIGFSIKVQDILHGGHEFSAYLGNAPFLLLPRLERVFFSRLRIPSWDMDDANPSSTTFPASRRNVQWSCPSGAGLQVSAIRWASPLSSNFLGRRGLGFSFMAASRPDSEKRRLTRNTVPSERSNDSATLGALHPSSVLRRIRARAVSRAGLLPLRINCCNCSRSFWLSLTGYRILPITTIPAVGSFFFANEDSYSHQIFKELSIPG